MSLVIAIFDPSRGSSIYGDRKRIFLDSDEKIKRSDEVSKIFSITGSLACGFTGNYDFGNALSKSVIRNKNEKPSSIITFIKSCFDLEPNTESTFVLAGIYDNNRPFIFGQSSSVKSIFEQEKGMKIFASEFNDECAEIFNDQIKLNISIDQACINTIGLASIKFPEHISENFDCIKMYM